MRCPKCGKDVELQNKQVGVDENGKPIFNEYAICRDCKKQWNLNKQREKKAVNTSAPVKKEAPKAAADKKAPVKAKPANTPAADAKSAPAKKSPGQDGKPAAVKKEGAPEGNPSAPAKKPVSPNGRPAAQAKRPASPDGKPAAPVKKAAPPDGKPVAPVKKAVSPDGRPAAPVKKPASPDGRPSAKGKRPVSPDGKPTAQAKRPAPPDGKPAQKRPAAGSNTASGNSQQKYGNIPPEKVRVKKEQAVKQSYEDMLSTDPNRKPMKKKRPDSDPERQPAKRPAPQPQKAPVEREEPEPRFRTVRIIFGIISILAFGFFAYKGFMAGLNGISAGSNAATGTIYIVLALCMLVSGLLLLIMQKKRTVFAFVLPMIFYIGSAVFAFLKRGNDKWLLYGAVAGAVLAVIFLILTIASRSGNEEDYEDEYDDPFEEDHDNY